MEELTRADWAEWQEHPVTKAMYKHLRDFQLSQAYWMGEGNSLSQNSDMTAQLTAKTVGKIEGAEQAFVFEIKDTEPLKESDKVDKEKLRKKGLTRRSTGYV